MNIRVPLPGSHRGELADAQIIAPVDGHQHHCDAGSAAPGGAVGRDRPAWA